MRISMLILSVIILTELCGFVGCVSKSDGKKQGTTGAASEIKSTGPLPDITIHEASLNGQLSEVKNLLSERNIVDSLDKDGRTALMYASFNGHSEIMKLLISKGANVNLYDRNGTTALMMASSGPYSGAVKLLLDNNADPNLVDKVEHFTALMYAASEGQIEVVRLLLARQANPVLKDVDGDDAETFARNNGHMEIADLLKSFKAKY